MALMVIVMQVVVMQVMTVVIVMGLMVMVMQVMVMQVMMVVIVMGLMVMVMQVMVIGMMGVVEPNHPKQRLSTTTELIRMEVKWVFHWGREGRLQHRSRNQGDNVPYQTKPG